MELIDLSRELFHRTQTHPSHPPVIMTVWSDHSEKKVAGNTAFSSKAMSLALSDHAGTHVDAPVHFDPRPGAASIDEVPLEKFFTSSICLDLSHVALKAAIGVVRLSGSTSIDMPFGGRPLVTANKIPASPSLRTASIARSVSTLSLVTRVPSTSARTSRMLLLATRSPRVAG